MTDNYLAECERDEKRDPLLHLDTQRHEDTTRPHTRREAEADLREGR